MKKFVTAPFLPTEVAIEKISQNVAKISAYPFESGYGITLAHPIRRLLMSSSVGYSVIAVHIEGAAHEFDTVRGMLEAQFSRDHYHAAMRLMSDEQVITAMAQAWVDSGGDSGGLDDEYVGKLRAEVKRLEGGVK